MKKAFLSAWKHTIPVLAGYIFLGITFGLLMKTAGFPLWCPVLMSIIIYSGALEFAAIPLMGAAFDPAGAFIMGIMISARHLFYGIPLLKKYENAGILRFPLIYTLSDETFSICSCTEPPEGIEGKYFYTTISVLNYLYWLIGTTVGWLFGLFITFDTTGIEFVLTALFIVLFVDQLKTKDGKTGGLVGIISSAVVFAFVGGDRLVLVSMLVILLVLLLMRRVNK